MPYRVLQMTDYLQPDWSVPQTPMPPFRDTLLPFNFLIPDGVEENSPMPRFDLEPGETGILVKASCQPRWLRGLFTRPEMKLNGLTVRQQTRWGTTFIPVPPGLHHLRVCPPAGPAPWPMRPGSTPPWPADTMVPVFAGRTTQVYSRASVSGGVNGAIGPDRRQRLPGVVWYSIQSMIFWPLLTAIIVLGALQFFD
ncbi:hypothetical protein DFR68_12212 [Nocardia mexicana]|uniref:Uncharacterized protein n=2 Tax=Nocardia mexicana TaxID=279262 RepID=A0A370GIQ8_9NOCA|nr:hypothetical protein DFR68_12212 [Nocardia mexicana]